MKAFDKDPLLSVRFHEAMTAAAEWHSTQTRKGGDIPYIAHLLGVTSIALEHGADEDEAIGALLHDAVEDQGGRKTLALIKERFGPCVADIVEACSDSYEDEPSKLSWRERKVNYIERMKTTSPSVVLVSASDKLHNLRSILMDYRLLGEALWPRFAGGREGTFWYYQSLATVFESKNVHHQLIRELRITVDVLEALMAENKK